MEQNYNTDNTEHCTDTITNLDPQGNINPDYYDRAIRACIEQYTDILGYDPNKLTNTNLLAIASHIYQSIFTPDKPQLKNRKCNIPYTTHNIESLIQIYINIWLDYGCAPSLFGFARMSGISTEIVKQYVTTSSLIFQNVNQSYLIGKLLDDGVVGHTVLANNESQFGLNYNRQNLLDHATVRQSLQAFDLVQIAQNKSQEQDTGE